MAAVGVYLGSKVDRLGGRPISCLWRDDLGSWSVFTQLHSITVDVVAVERCCGHHGLRHDR
ncbi:MAG: hypothetical protein CM15mP120_02100 [Pseudomonadota bacterium]|nr:MAG: hypothetical protein CM15mP120_02100 [Pseudomonadota bacterium]